MKIKTASKYLLAFALLGPIVGTANAAGSKPPSTPTQPTPPPAQNRDVIIDLGLNIAITYAKMDARYASVLSVLGISSADDLKAFLQGNSNGLNFKAIVARLAWAEAQKDPKIKAVFKQLGVTDEASLRVFLADPQQVLNVDFVLELALAQAKTNPKYGTWLNRMNIQTVQDLRNLMSGRGQGNLQTLVLVIGLSIVQDNPKYDKYAPLIEAAMLTLGVKPGDDGSNVPDTSDDDIINLGPYNGMTNGEVKAVRKLK